MRRNPLIMFFLPMLLILGVMIAYAALINELSSIIMPTASLLASIMAPLLVLNILRGRKQRDRSEALKKIVNEMEGEFIKGELIIREQIEGWPIFINIRRPRGAIIIQVSAPYVKKDNFRFSITESGVKSNMESKVQSLLANSRIRELIDTHISGLARFEITHNALQFVANVKYLDVARLRSLLELFAETLTQLCQIGSAYEGIPSKRSDNLIRNQDQ